MFDREEKETLIIHYNDIEASRKAKGVRGKDIKMFNGKQSLTNTLLKGEEQ